MGVLTAERPAVAPARTETMIIDNESVPAADIKATLTGAGDGLLEACWLFDTYRSEQLGAGKKSVAYRLRFRAEDRTLDDSELADLRQKAIDAVKDIPTDIDPTNE